MAKQEFAFKVPRSEEPYNGQHLHKAVMQNNEESILKILSSGEVSIEVTDVLGYTPLMNASQKGYLNIVNILLEHGADVEAQNASGKNSLMLACFIGNLEVVKRLRLSGASWDVIDRGGSTPVHWAVDSGNHELVEWMINDGAKIGIRDRTAGWTPLLRCCALSGNINVAHSLISMGSKVNASDEDGKTPLMIATLNGHTDLVKELIKYGADINTKNKYGKSAIDMAKSFDRRPLLKYFEELLEQDDTTKHLWDNVYENNPQTSDALMSVITEKTTRIVKDGMCERVVGNFERYMQGVPTNAI